MSADQVKRLWLLAANEASLHEHSMSALSKAGWAAFHLLADWEFAEARQAVIDGLKEARTPGQLADLRYATDAAFADAGEWASPTEMSEVVKLRDELREYRQLRVERIQQAYQTLEGALVLYRRLRGEARNLLYLGLQE